MRTPAARERIAFLGGEPDRWRIVSEELPLGNANNPDHYFDLEELGLLRLESKTLPIFRYDFAAKLAVERAAHPEKFPPIDAARNKDHSRVLVGFLPWSITEYAGRLKSGFSYLNTFEANGGTPEEIANAQQNILYFMGILGHFVGDASQPLHTTIHHRGWVGANPHGYTTDFHFHQWIDGDYFLKTGGVKLEALQDNIRPVRAVGDRAKPEMLFGEIMSFIEDGNKQVETLYQLDKEGKLSGEGEHGMGGKAFLEGQLVKGGQMLGDIWYSMWLQAPEDKYLKQKLAERNAANVPNK